MRKRLDENWVQQFLVYIEYSKEGGRASVYLELLENSVIKYWSHNISIVSISSY